MVPALPPLKCNGCRKCCLGDTIDLLPGDNPSQYKTKLVDGVVTLAKGKDGNCVYLGKSGCQIHGRQPRMCRQFDCRKYAFDVSRLPADAQRERARRPSVVEGQRRLAELGTPVEIAQPEAA